MDNARILLVQEAPRGPSTTIEVAIAPGISSVAFNVEQDLISNTTQNVIITSLRLVTAPELAFATVSGLVNAPLTECQKVSALVYAEGWNKGFNIPVLSLNNVFTEGSGFPFRDRTQKLANWKDVVWNKTQLIFSNGQPSVGTYSFIFEVEYVRYDAKGVEIIGPSN
jgi:hypothetical protein